MEALLTHAVLKAKQRELRDGFPETMGLRVHRAISWIGRAEAAGDDDARFLFLWIGFDAAYADEEEVQNLAAPERDAFKEYFQKVVRLDAGQRIYDAIWDNFSGPIQVLLHNKYVFTPFWKHHNAVEGFGDWEEWFRASERRFRRALEERNTVRVLRLVFDRLYLLRNQIVHGGATWNSRVNRDQVRGGTRDPRLSHARVRRHHDGQSARGPGASVLSGRGIGLRGVQRARRRTSARA